MSRPDCTWRARAEIDVLHMGMGDSVGYLSGKFGWIRATDEQVTGVQAQGDRGALEHPLHLLAVLDHRSDMWVEHRARIVLGGTASIRSRLASRVTQPCSSRVGRVS